MYIVQPSTKLVYDFPKVTWWEMILICGKFIHFFGMQVMRVKIFNQWMKVFRTDLSAESDTRRSGWGTGLSRFSGRGGIEGHTGC